MGRNASLALFGKTDELADLQSPMRNYGRRGRDDA
jgi:hypothetical protein